MKSTRPIEADKMSSHPPCCGSTSYKQQSKNSKCARSVLALRAGITCANHGTQLIVRYCSDSNSFKGQAKETLTLQGSSVPVEYSSVRIEARYLMKPRYMITKQARRPDKCDKSLTSNVSMFPSLIHLMASCLLKSFSRPSPCICPKLYTCMGLSQNNCST